MRKHEHMPSARRKTVLRYRGTSPATSSLVREAIIVDATAYLSRAIGSCWRKSFSRVEFCDVLHEAIELAFNAAQQRDGGVM
jgi:hypothetical protein